jgi:NAD(P)-dependent dehydrogenase (short-subunit alcohol dehydrogenase family)
MSRYAEVHKNPQGPGDARPNAIQIIEDEGVKGKLEGKVIVITGCSSGIGIETARALSLTGARLYLTARDLNKGRTALEGILEHGRVELIEMDNLSFESVRKAAAEVLSKTNNQVNLLVANAGIMALPSLEYTVDGHEKQFGVNHLAHFLFFQLLKPALLASASPELSSRVVMLSSSGHNMAGINESDNYNYQKGEYSDIPAYGQSKTANIYMSNAIERKYGSKGLHSTSVHPGVIHTGLSQHMDPDILAAMGTEPDLGLSMKSVEQGAATTVWAAIGKEWENKGGQFLSDVNTTTLTNTDKFWKMGHAAWAYDAEKENRLWEDSLKIVGVQE